MEPEDNAGANDWFVERGFLLEPISSIAAGLLGADTSQIMILYHRGDGSLRTYYQMRTKVCFVGLMREEQLPNSHQIIRVYGLSNYALLERLARDMTHAFGAPVQLRVASQVSIYNYLF